MDIATLGLRVDSSGVKKANADLDRFEREARQADRAAVKLGRATRSSFSTLAVGAARARTSALALKGALVGYGAIRFGRSVLDQFVEFDRSLVKINTLVGIQQDQINAWRADVRAAGKDFGRSAGEMADALFFITSAGLRGQKAIEALRSSAAGSLIGLGSTEKIADAATSAINAYGAANLSAGKSVAILTAAVREGKADASTLAPALQRNIPIASELGVRFDEVAAAIAAITRISGDAAKAGTGLESILFGLLRPTEQAEKVFNKAGLSIEQLRANIQDRGLLDTLELLRAKVGDNKDALARLFESREAVTAFFTLLGKNAENTRAIFKALAGDVEGEFKESVETASQSVSGKLDKSLASISDKMIALGETQVPEAVHSFELLLDIFNKLNGPATSQFSLLSVINVGLAKVPGLIDAIERSAEHLNPNVDAVGIGGLNTPRLLDLTAFSGTRGQVNSSAKSGRLDVPGVPLPSRRPTQPGSRISFSKPVTDQQKQVLADLKFEQEQLRRTSREQEIYNALQQAGVERSSEFGGQIAKTAGQLYDARLQQEELNNRLQFFGDIASGAFSDLASGAADFETVMQRVIQSLADAAIQAALLGQGPLASLFGTQSASGGVGGLFGALFGAKNGAVLANGNITPFVRGGIVNRPTIFPMANGTGLMGEAGPEAIMPLRRGPGGRLGVETSGMSVTAPITVNLDARGADRDALERAVARIEAEVPQRAVEAVREAQSRRAL